MDHHASRSTILDSGLLDVPFSELIAQKIFLGLMGCSPTNDELLFSDIAVEYYWRYYSKECSQALQDGGRHVATRTHRDIADCARKLRDDMPRRDIRNSMRWKVSRHHVNVDEMLDNSIDLAASLLLMTNFGCYPYGFSGRRQLCWKGENSLRHFVRDHFAYRSELACEGVKFEKVFTARNLERIAGLTTVWTDNLIDHLRLTDGDQRVHIFHHASFLEYQKLRCV